MKRVLDIIDNISEYTGKICRWAIVLLALVMCYEVFSRYVFGKPTIWSFEISVMLYAFYFMMNASYALLYKSHVSIDIFYEKLSKRGKALLDIISSSMFFFPFLIVILIHGTEFAADAWKILERSWSNFAPPLYPIKTVVPVFAFLLLLQGFALLYRNFQILITGECYESKYKKVECMPCGPDTNDCTTQQ
jgi:TRAP-type mannitol/chloroaromatic compound transport system permease small subunit